MCRLLTSVFFLCLFPTMAHALADDKSQPIHMEADRFELDDKRGVSTYTGNVSFQQGSILIKAQKVEVYTENREFHRLHAQGQLATFSQDLEGDDKRVSAEAREIDYAASGKLLILKGEAQLQRRDDVFSGEVIHYNLGDETVKAEKGKGVDDGRVTITIMPKAQPSNSQ